MLPVRDDVLVEAQLTAGADNAKHLRERLLLVGHAAEHQRGDTGIEGPILARKTITDSIDHGHRDRRVCRCLLSTFAQIPLGLNRGYLLDSGRVVRKVRAAAGTDLDHPTVQTLKQLAAMASRFLLPQTSSANSLSGL